MHNRIQWGWEVSEVSEAVRSLATRSTLSMQAQPVPLLRQDDWWVEVLRGGEPRRSECERELLEQGFPLPLPHRTAWATLKDPDRSWFVALRDELGICRAGFALFATPSRALPGHCILRVEHWGHGLTPGQLGLGIQAIRKLAHQLPRILRAHVEFYSLEGEVAPHLEEQFHTCGFQRVSPVHCYPRTIMIDLNPEEAEIFASFHRTARRHIRAVDKNPVQARCIEDPRWIPRMKALHRETMERTGGQLWEPDWSAILQLSKEHPESSRLVGLFRTDAEGPESLLAFAWGGGHGDHVHYDTAASTRNTDLRMPLAYGLVWDLVCWAKQNGCTRFDFGGVTEGEHGGDDPLGGISDFKRYFSKTVVSVGSEWILEPYPIRARIAKIISTGASWIRRASRFVSEWRSNDSEKKS